MGSLVNVTILFLSLIFVRLTTCHPKLKTIKFMFTSMSTEQLSNYSSLRDIPFPENRFIGIPYYLIVKALAEKLNVTNIVTQNWFSPEVLESVRSNTTPIMTNDQVSILAPVSAFSNSVAGLKYQWERFTSPDLKPISFVTNNLLYNFVYCDIPSWKKEPVWSMRELTSVLDNTCWICMSATTLIIFIALGRDGFDTNFLVLLSSILCSGSSGTLKKRALLVVAWIIPLRILVDMYSSDVSSRLISPPAERAFTKFADLDKYNYSTAVTGDNVAPALLQFFSFMGSNQTGTWVNQGFAHLSKVYARQVVVNPGFLDPFKMGQFLVEQHKSKVFYTNLWYFPMLMLNVIEAARDNELKTFDNGALCHLGEETLNGGANFWVFLAPNHETIAGYFKRTIETGIFNRLEKEHEGFSHSLRVQERYRVVSKTYLKESRNGERLKEVLNNQLQGKMAKVFFLWAVCILLCFIGMGLELAYSFKTKSKVDKLEQTLNYIQYFLK